MGLKNNRATISFSEIGDAELLEVLETVNYNFAGFCKQLMKDGLKYREMVEQPTPYFQKAQPVRKSFEPRQPVQKPVPSSPSKEELAELAAKKLDLNF